MKASFIISVALLAISVESDINVHPLNAGNQCYCGVPNLGSDRIINGEDTNEGEYPWQVSLHHKYLEHYCGGTLVGEEHVITADHCFDFYPPEDFTIILGRTNHKEGQQAHITRRIAEYKKPYWGFYEQNDIAVLVLDEPVNLTTHPDIKPACLPKELAIDDVQNQLAVASGWGKMEDGDYPDQLQDVPIYILGKGKENCGKYDGWWWYMDDDFCAGHLEGFQDTCQGDSGGPLIAKDNVDNNGAATLFGVVSRGEGCARPGYPGIYADVPYHLQRGKFLDRELRDLKTCGPPPYSDWYP